jgi:hypothetical protein
MESAPSRTAMFAAVSRGLFRLEMASPWVLDDVLALLLVGPAWQQLRDQFDPACARSGDPRGHQVVREMYLRARASLARWPVYLRCTWTMSQRRVARSRLRVPGSHALAEGHADRGDSLRRSAIAFSSMPASSISVTAPCRKSCRRTDGRPVRPTRAMKVHVRTSGDNGPPSSRLRRPRASSCSCRDM